jgi:ribosome recycling factor
LLALLGLLSNTASAQGQSLDQILLDAETQMDSPVKKLQADLATIRTNRITSLVFSKVSVNYYGTPAPLLQLANVTVPEPRMAIVAPYDKSMLTPIATAISAALGVTTSNDGTMLRVVFPQLSEDQRRELIKTVNSYGENAKIALRNIRRKSKDQLDRTVVSGTATAADVTRATASLNDSTNTYVLRVDEMVKKKTVELLEL